MVNLRNYLKSVTPAYWDAKDRAARNAFAREAQGHSLRFMDEIDRIARLPDKRSTGLQGLMSATGTAFAQRKG